MDEALIRELVARILASPQLEALLGTTTATAPGKRNALVVIENEAGARSLSELQRLWGASYQLHVCAIGGVSLPACSLPQLSAEQALSGGNWCRILIPVCAGRQLASIAQGIETDKVCELAAFAIRNGIPVDIGQVDYAFTDKTPESYRSLFASYEKQVRSFGVSVGQALLSSDASILSSSPGTVVPIRKVLPDLLPWNTGEPVKPQEPENRSTVTYAEGLMTAKEAMLLTEHAILRLEKGTVLTPSAIDTLKKLKVQVFKEGVRFL